MKMIIFLAFSLFLQGALGVLVCEELPVGLCSFSIASSGKRCMLETYTSNDGTMHFQCKTSEVVATNFYNYIEADECIRACGVDRKSVGISSDSLLDFQFTAKLCSPRCYQNCPNVVDLYYNLALGEDWGGNVIDRTSTCAYIVFLGSNPISWSSKKQPTVARSSTEAEYRSIASTTPELTWIHNLLTEIGFSLTRPAVVFCDNVGETYLCANPIFHSRMKHITHVSSSDQLVDALTKPLPGSQLGAIRVKIGVHPSSILRGCIGN